MLGALTASGVMSCSGGTPGAWSDIDINGWRYGRTVTLTPDSTATDTVDVTLADEWGRWRGHGSGVTYQNTDTVRLRHHLRQGGSLHLRHIMRLDTLTEIEQIGITPLPPSKHYEK